MSTMIIELKLSVLYTTKFQTLKFFNIELKTQLSFYLFCMLFLFNQHFERIVKSIIGLGCIASNNCTKISVLKAHYYSDKCNLRFWPKCSHKLNNYKALSVSAIGSQFFLSHRSLCFLRGYEE